MDRSSLVLALMLAAGVPSAHVGPERHELFAQRSSPDAVPFQHHRPPQEPAGDDRPHAQTLSPGPYHLVPILRRGHVIVYLPVLGSPHAGNIPENRRPYVRKCCPWGQVYGDGGCENVDINSIPRFQVPMLVNVSEIVSYEASEFPILAQRQTCKRNLFLLEPSKDQDDSFKITRTGQLVSLLDEKNDASPEQYCLEQFKDHDYNVMAIVCEREGPS